jgi:hypothetical protein
MNLDFLKYTESHKSIINGIIKEFLQEDVKYKFEVLKLIDFRLNWDKQYTIHQNIDYPEVGDIGSVQGVPIYWADLDEKHNRSFLEIISDRRHNMAVYTTNQRQAKEQMFV